MSYLETYYSFLKTITKELQEEPDEPDRARGVPAPPGEKPYPEDATLIDMTSPVQLAFGRMPVAQAV